MQTITSALYNLSRSGYKAYIPVDMRDKGFIVEDMEGRLAKVLVRRASRTDKTPILTLSNQQKSQTYLQQYGYILVTEPVGLMSWLIPLESFPTDVRTIRLGEKWHRFLLKPLEKASSVLSKTIRAEVTDRIRNSVELSQNQIENLFE